MDEIKKNRSIRTPSGSGKGATGRGTPAPDIAPSADEALATILLPGVEIPSLNRLLRMHFGARCALSGNYRRLLASSASSLRAAIAGSRSIVIICWADSSRSATRSRGSSAATTPNIAASSGSTGRNRGRYARWKYGKYGKKG